MSLSLRRHAATLTLVALLAVLSSCSKRDEGNTEIALTQAQADDITQVLASTTAFELGGWMTQLESTIDQRPRGVLPIPTPFRGEPFQVATGLPRDTVVTRGPTGNTIDWHLSYTYYDTSFVEMKVWDGSQAKRVQLVSGASGTIQLVDFNGFSGPVLWGHADTLLVDGYQDSTLVMNALSIDDTAFVDLTNGTIHRYYHFDNIVDLNLAAYRVDGTGPYPFGGDAVVHAFIDVLRSPSRTDRSNILDAVMTITFDGTEQPVVSITANTSTPTAVFHYTYNLRTGVIARAP